MTTLIILRDCARWGSVAFGVIAAALWYRASTVKVSEQQTLREDRRDGTLGPDDHPGGIFVDDDTDFVASMLASSRWNKWAAAATGVATLLQAVAAAMRVD